MDEPSPEPAPTRVTVDIYGQQYALVGPADEAYLRDLAARLDARMRQLAERRPRLSLSQAAVLVALNVLDEHTRLEAEHRRLVALWERSLRMPAAGGSPVAAHGPQGGSSAAEAPPASPPSHAPTRGVPAPPSGAATPGAGTPARAAPQAQRANTPATESARGDRPRVPPVPGLHSTPNGRTNPDRTPPARAAESDEAGPPAERP